MDLNLKHKLLVFIIHFNEVHDDLVHVVRVLNFTVFPVPVNFKILHADRVRNATVLNFTVKFVPVKITHTVRFKKVIILNFEALTFDFIFEYQFLSFVNWFDSNAVIVKNRRYRFVSDCANPQND